MFNELVCLSPPFTLPEISSPYMREEFAASIGFLLESDHENKIIWGKFAEPSCAWAVFDFIVNLISLVLTSVCKWPALFVLQHFSKGNRNWWSVSDGLNFLSKITFKSQF